MASDRGWRVMSSSLAPLKTRHVVKRYTLNMSRAQTSSHWRGVVVKRGGVQLRCQAAVVEWYRYRIMTCLVTSSRPVPLKIRRVG
ncbi:hypothetical protein TNCV_2642371 [Trichonephila clavipes]|nr:hypothetical protein TNCV_2642371 [Trichonephila clavipes]